MVKQRERGFSLFLEQLEREMVREKDEEREEKRQEDEEEEEEERECNLSQATNPSLEQQSPVC